MAVAAEETVEVHAVHLAAVRPVYQAEEIMGVLVLAQRKFGSHASYIQGIEQLLVE